jgi:hypothetical protein
MTRRGLSIAALCQLALALALVAAPAASAQTGASVASTNALLLPQGSRFICNMVDEGPSSPKAWVYCWEYLSGGSVGRHVRLDPGGGVSLSATEPVPVGIGGPGQPYGAWVTIGRFRCEVLKQGVECVVVATGKGFLAKGDEVVEVQTPPGVIEPPPVLGQSVTVETASGIVFVQTPGSKFSYPLNTGVRVPVGTVIDATRGTVRLSSAVVGGTTQAGLFRGGLFRVTQPRARSVNQGAPEDLTVLSLIAPVSKDCDRHLWGDGRGNFQIDGRYASAATNEAKWLVSDGCAGTLVKVARGAVTVEDSIRHRTATVAAGHTYTAYPSPTRGVSHALIWRALGGKVICGVVDHAEGAPATAMLCFSKSVPPPGGTTNAEGDPGFVFLRATGGAHPTRISQYSWIPEDGWLPKNQTPLGAGARWSYSQIGVKCMIAASRVRCSNRSGHGFTITHTSYRSF